MIDLYSRLELPPIATPEEIRAAYRRKAQTMHPDKGGTVEEFQMLKEAYEILSDPIKRKHYDEHGTILKGNDLLEEACELILNIIDHHPEGFDPITEAVRFIGAQIAGLERNIQENENKRRKLQKAFKRIKRKSGENLVAQILQSQLDRVAGGSTSAAAEIVRLNLLRDFFSEYEWDHQFTGQFGNHQFLYLGDQT